jgi:hypothetical protein
MKQHSQGKIVKLFVLLAPKSRDNKEDQDTGWMKKAAYRLGKNIRGITQNATFKNV